MEFPIDLSFALQGSKFTTLRPSLHLIVASAGAAMSSATHVEKNGRRRSQPAHARCGMNTI